MIGFEMYSMQHAMNLHFSEVANYDFFKYNGKTRLNFESFKKSKFRWQFAASEKKSSDILFHLYLLYKGNKFEYMKVNNNMFLRARRASKDFSIDRDTYLLETISNDLMRLRSTHSDNLYGTLSTNALYPTIYTEYENGDISVETLLLFDTYVLNVLNLDSSHDIISWPIVLKKFERIKPFVTQFFSGDKFMNLFSDIYLDTK